MVRLSPETAEHLYRDYAPLDVGYRRGSRPQLEAVVDGLTLNEDRLAALVAFCAGLGDRADDGFEALRLGGTEEEIIDRGSDWCTDVARVACALCQVAGLPARLVYLADTAQAYSGHAIIEVHRDGGWGAADPTTAVVYRQPDGRPASTWDLMCNPALIAAHHRGPTTPFTTADQFRAAAIANYFIRESDRYDYTVSGLNAYYRSILEMSARGWPGGLRWLHGEDERKEARRQAPGHV